MIKNSVIKNGDYNLSGDVEINIKSLLSENSHQFLKKILIERMDTNGDVPEELKFFIK